jgi:hypothetical protein
MFSDLFFPLAIKLFKLFLYPLKYRPKLPHGRRKSSANEKGADPGVRSLIENL